MWDIAESSWRKKDISQILPSETPPLRTPTYPWHSFRQTHLQSANYAWLEMRCVFSSAFVPRKSVFIFNPSSHSEKLTAPCNLEALAGRRVERGPSSRTRLLMEISWQSGQIVSSFALCIQHSYREQPRGGKSPSQFARLLGELRASYPGKDAAVGSRTTLENGRV